MYLGAVEILGRQRPNESALRDVRELAQHTWCSDQIVAAWAALSCSIRPAREIILSSRLTQCSLLVQLACCTAGGFHDPFNADSFGQ